MPETPPPTRRHHGQRWLAGALIAASVTGVSLPANAAPQGGSSVTNPGLLQQVIDDQNAANCSNAGSKSKGDAELGGDGSNAPTSGDAKKNASAIVSEAERRGLPVAAAEIGVATAMVESNLINVNYGDDKQGVTNPDGSLTTSIGLFQQQDFWGSKADRMDPAKSAGLFYDHLTKFDWKSMDQGAAAQKVQGSAFPDKYGQRMADAKTMVQDSTKDTGGYKADENAAKDEGGSDSKDSGSSGAEGSNGGDSAACASGGESSGNTGNTGKGETTGKGDDYPDEWKNKCDAADPWGLIACQCVSWAAWRFNVQKGSKDGDWKFTMNTVNAMGQGNGYQWGGAFKAAGYKVDKEPAVGSGAWWDQNVGAAGSMGHLAIVEDTDKEKNRVYVSQYNAYPKEKAYSEQWYNIDDLSGFIHYADTSDVWGHPKDK